ncbi:MAG: response regulator transcription factor [Leptolyngbyaceae cyanobacterium SM2_5_2]|nr:response regulator transcription factor [Leptolyngbyaceae cyanobacterium SM2_5_2]
MCRVLIAEDEARIAAFMEKGLRQAGYMPTIASDGEMAINAALAQSFQLVLLDLGLPKRDGQEVLQTLRERGITCPIIVVTARSLSTAKISATQEMADDWVNKPFKMKDLLQRIARLLPAKD